MKLLDARVNGMPRNVTTKYGDKSVLDVATSEGQFTIWRPAGDSEVMGRRNGERVTIALDSKGKASLVDHASNSPAVGLANTQPAAVTIPFEAEMKLKQQMGFHKYFGIPVAASLYVSPFTRNTPITNRATVRTSTCFMSCQSLSPFLILCSIE